MVRINEDRRLITSRTELLRAVGTAVFVILILGFWYHQILHRRYYQELSENNRLKLDVLYAPRGLMLDREGRILAGNHLSFDLELVPEEVHTPIPSLLAQISTVIGVPSAELRERLEEASSQPDFRPVVLKENLSLEEVSWFAARRENHAGLQVRQRNLRHYEAGPLAAHLVGYVGEVTAEQLVAGRGAGSPLQAGDLIGKAGLEKRYNDYLQGINGLRQMVVNSYGREVREHSRRQPIQGCTHWLTIDLDLQRVAEEAFGDETGAAVFLDPRSGQILALVSRPAFDPQNFAQRLSRSFWQSIVSDPEHPLQNRLIQSKYAPGSVFKIIMAAAGLEEGTLSPGSVKGCPGQIFLYNRVFHCWKPGGHGSLPLEQAIQRSCNVYFYQVGAQLGIEKIHKWGQRFGLGQKTGIDLEGEAAGTLPSTAWKKRTFGQPWYAGETISVSIGQGYLELTPVQMAVFMAALANGGTRYRPYLVRRIETREGYRQGVEAAPEAMGDLGLRPSTLAVLRRAMWLVVNEPGGTAGRARVAGFDVCGKTGTAQIHRSSAGVRPEHLARAFRDHAWFGGFAPLARPEVAFAVFIEHGGHGGETAAPIVRQVLETYFKKHHPERWQELHPEELPEGEGTLPETRVAMLLGD